MTKTKTYKYGPNTFKTYFKPVGKGYEVGMTYQDRPMFVSNFVRKTEATKWWGMFNKEIFGFAKKYNYTHTMPFSWYCNFLANHLNKFYFNWLDKVFAKHEITFKKSFTRDAAKYSKMAKTKKSHSPTPHHPYMLKAV
jgi:hypothetical protein